MIISGFTASVKGCIRKAVYALLERGYNPIVLEDCISTSLQKMKTECVETLNEYRAHKNIQVVNSTKIDF